MKKILSALIFLILFTCLSGQDKYIDKRDGNGYRTITIAGVTWMAENLKYKIKAGAHYFDNDPNNIPGYGVLYEWKTALNVCPKNWHLPSGAEFRTLTNHFEQKETWRKIASEPSSFGIQLGGMQDYEGTFSEMDESGYYWTSTAYDKSNAEYFSYLLINEMPVIDISRREDIPDIQGTEKSNKYSVRCVKD
ncbi:MAG TPA: FISUMP domain-containing protein [Anaerovoracaceae bacterium]|nr:FISUMP domain-containing protein [Anaerovoracaceae bacterium]